MAIPRIVKLPDNFHGKRNEDGDEWLSTYIKIAVANGWNDAKKLEVVPLYLKDIAGRWYDEWAAANLAQGWPGAAPAFVGAFRARFQNEFQMNMYEDQWDSLQQGRKKIEEYVDEFIRLRAKVDNAAALPAAMVKKKFIRGLNPKIAAMVYAQNPANLQAAIDAVTLISTEYELTTGNPKIGNVRKEKDDNPELQEQITNLAMVDQMRNEEKQKSQADTRP